MRSVFVILSVLAVMLCASAPANADLTAFAGANATPSNRPVKGFAAGLSLLVIGFEFEFSDTAADEMAGAPGLRTGMFNLLLKTPFGISGLRFYGTVGGAMTNYEIVVTDRIDDRTGAIDQTLYGYVLGGGAEYAMTENVSVRLDYSFHDFGSQRYDFNDVNIDFEDEDVGLTLQTFKLGISYRF